MIQCSECEDWFHNTHLTPSQASNNVPPEFNLLCRNCVRSKGPDFANLLRTSLRKYLYKDTVKTLNEIESKELESKDQIYDHEPEKKRQKTDIQTQSKQKSQTEDLYFLPIDQVNPEMAQKDPWDIDYLIDMSFV